MSGQQKQLLVENEPGLPVGHAHRQGRLLLERQTALARQSGAERDLRRRAEGQAGDAVSLALVRDSGLRLGGLKADPVARHDVGAPRWRAGEVDAGERRVAFWFGADLADQQPGRHPQFGLHLLVAWLVRGALDHRADRGQSLNGAVEALERVDQQEQRRDLRFPGVGQRVGQPCGLGSAGRVGRIALELRRRQREPEWRLAVTTR